MIVAVVEVPPGPVIVTVAVPLPVDGAVNVNGVPLVGAVVLRLPAVVDAASVPEPPVRVAVSDTVPLLAAVPLVGDTDSE